VASKRASACIAFFLGSGVALPPSVLCGALPAGFEGACGSGGGSGGGEDEGGSTAPTTAAGAAAAVADAVGARVGVGVGAPSAAGGGRGAPLRARRVRGGGEDDSGELAAALLLAEARLTALEDERAGALLGARAAAEGERAARHRAAAAELAREDLETQLLGARLSMARLVKQLEDAGVGTVVDAADEGGAAGEAGAAAEQLVGGGAHLAIGFFPAPLEEGEGEEGGEEGLLAPHAEGGENPRAAKGGGGWTDGKDCQADAQMAALAGL
jgi:hypothetical protein